MAQTEEIHGYYIQNNGDVSNGLKYLGDYWDTEKVMEIFKGSRAASAQGYEFEFNSYGYTLFWDGDNNYFLKPR